MNYITVAQAAEKWGISERRVRDYCAKGRVTGAHIKGNKWVLPETAKQPERKNSGKKSSLLTDALSEAVMTGIPNNVYEYVKVNFTYHSVAMDSSSVTLKQVQKGFADRKFNLLLPDINTDDTLTAANHFLCIDKVIEGYRKPLSVDMVKELHSALGIMTERYQKNTRSYDGYRTFDCKVGNRKATAPERIYKELPILIEQYESKEIITLEDILDFHYRFERIRPYAENNGLIGRLLIFKECLRNGITPFIIDSAAKQRYFDGLNQWEHDRRELIDISLDAQVTFKHDLNI